MTGFDATLVASLQHWMDRDEVAILEDADLVGEGVNFDGASAGRIRHAVGIAADADHALARDAAHQAKHSAEWRHRQWAQVRAFFGEGLVDDALRRGVAARVGDGVEPMAELAVEIVEIAERPRQKEILPDIAERSLDLALRLGAVGPTGPRMEAEVAGEVDQATIVDDAVGITLASDRSLHPIVEQLAGDTADRFEGGSMAPQHRRQVLMQDEASPDQAAVAEHHGEQPDNPRRQRFIVEDDMELRKIDLGLLAGLGLEPHLISGRRRRPDIPQEVRDGGITALVAAVFQLSEQPPPGQAGIARRPLPEIRGVRLDHALTLVGGAHRPVPPCRARCICGRSCDRRRSAGRWPTPTGPAGANPGSSSTPRV